MDRFARISDAVRLWRRAGALLFGGFLMSSGKGKKRDRTLAKAPLEVM